MDQLKAVPGLRFGRWPCLTRSAASMPPGVAAAPRLAARSKWLTPTPLYINGRHHANEVSGTNANFEVLRAVMSDPKYADLPRG